MPPTPTRDSSTQLFLGLVVEEGGVLPTGVRRADLGDAVEGLVEVLEVGQPLGAVLVDPDLGVGVAEERGIDPRRRRAVFPEVGEVLIERRFRRRGRSLAVGVAPRPKGVGDVELVEVALHLVDGSLLVALGRAIQIDERLAPFFLRERWSRRAADLAARFGGPAVVDGRRVGREGFQSAEGAEQRGGLALREARPLKSFQNTVGRVAAPRGCDVEGGRDVELLRGLPAPRLDGFGLL
mmetsp:Transcript_19911/g.79365  ORF Transcript_19911/g.79365 Transcript_19911/m.79365 type:complete len:238 (+) Transcript_19911:720-1433(+)